MKSIFRSPLPLIALMLGGILALGLASCGRDNKPTAPKSFVMSGHVVLRGFLVDADGKFAGTKVVGNADGVGVQLLNADTVIAQATTVGGIYKFQAIPPGTYFVRAPVMPGLSFETTILTVANSDLAIADTLHLTSHGDIYPVPNPFSDATLGYFELSDSSLVDGNVLNLAGKNVRHLITAGLHAGLWQMRWDGLDDAGLLVPDPITWLTLQEPQDSRAQLIFREPNAPAPAALVPTRPGPNANVRWVGPVGASRPGPARLPR